MVVARGQRDPRRTLDRRWQNESVVVIGMLTDHVHAAWRTRDERRAPAKATLELAQQVVVFHSYTSRKDVPANQSFLGASIP